MAVRDDFAPGEVLAAADLNDTFASKLDFAGGKILQIVRATDSIDRTTTSSSYVDVTGMQVTITPQKNDSAILIVATCVVEISHTSSVALSHNVRITDSSNNAISGAEQQNYKLDAATEGRTPFTSIAYATPATTSPTTYKLRMARAGAYGTITIKNTLSTGQMYAIEVSA